MRTAATREVRVKLNKSTASFLRKLPRRIRFSLVHLRNCLSIASAHCFRRKGELDCRYCKTFCGARALPKELHERNVNHFLLTLFSYRKRLRSKLDSLLIHDSRLLRNTRLRKDLQNSSFILKSSIVFPTRRPAPHLTFPTLPRSHTALRFLTTGVLRLVPTSRGLRLSPSPIASSFKLCHSIRTNSRS